MGSQCPQLYGLPKVHKNDVPLRPILSMTGLRQHELAKWLAELIRPVSEYFSTFCISDLFTFSEFVRNYPINSRDKILVSFGIVSLYTNIPLQETVQICADVLYRGCLGPVMIPQTLIL